LINSDYIYRKIH